MYFAIAQTEQQQSAIGIPLDARQRRIFQFLAPNPIAIHWTDNDRTVFVDDTNLLAIRRPRHPFHRGLLAIVRHFFVPRVLCMRAWAWTWSNLTIHREIAFLYLVQHPHHDDTIAIGRRQLLLRIIPCDHVHGGLVPFKRLIHAQITGWHGTRTSCNHIISIRLIQFQHFHQTIFAADGNVALIFVPCYAIDSSVIWYCDLCQVNQEKERF